MSVFACAYAYVRNPAYLPTLTTQEAWTPRGQAPCQALALRWLGSCRQLPASVVNAQCMHTHTLTQTPLEACPTGACPAVAHAVSSAFPMCCNPLTFSCGVGTSDNHSQVDHLSACLLAFRSRNVAAVGLATHGFSVDNVH